MSEYDIVPTDLVVKAMRDNGYKNAAYAIAELMDNSIQADARNVELICIEKKIQLKQREVPRIFEIGILDDGCGMNVETLQIALQFGNGTRLNDHSGIGRFGMGLPNSSISQAQRVDVWSWQSGVENAIHTYIDLVEMEKGQLKHVPAPSRKKIPNKWKVKADYGKSGTLVVWSNLDKIIWTKGETILKNSELLIGRMYRYFISAGSVKIRLKCFEDESDTTPKINNIAKANDPLYLMSNTSTPVPYDVNPLFSQGNFEPTYFDVQYNGAIHTVEVKFSYAIEEARQGHNPGRRDYGTHAKRNVGVSIVRAKRELDLDASWTDPSNPLDRWWGVEVSFPPTLDDVFGVTNNKQSARNFTELAKISIADLADDYGISLGATEEILNTDEDPRLALLVIGNHIKNQIAVIRQIIKAQTANDPKTKKSRHSVAEEIGTAVTQERISEGYHGASDKEQGMSEEDKIDAITEELELQGVSKGQATQMAEHTVRRKLKYQFVKGALSGPAFFDVKSRGGAIIIALNIEHPAYSHLVELLEDSILGLDADNLAQRLMKAKEGLELLIMAWARFEDEQPPGPRLNAVQAARWDWGRMAKDFLHDTENQND